MTLRVSFIEVSIVVRMLLFNLSSISDRSWSLLVVIFSLSHSSIFLISLNIAVVALLGSVAGIDIVGDDDGLLGRFLFLVAEAFSPVDRLLFFPLTSETGLVVGLGILVGDGPMSTINWLIWGCSSGFANLNFLPFLDADMIHKVLHYGTPINTLVRLIITLGMPDNFNYIWLP